MENLQRRVVKNTGIKKDAAVKITAGDVIYQQTQEIKRLKVANYIQRLLIKKMAK